MRYLLATIIICAALAATGAPAYAGANHHADGPLQLFGVTLKGASRAELRKAFHQTGLGVIRENDNYWVDEYNASGVLDGASGLDVGYVAKNDTFAFAEYTFKAFMDTGLVTKVAKMVTSKYGPPSRHSGRDNLGPVTYVWTFPHHMEIKVSRGWPSTTTYLDYIDGPAKARMDSEIQAVKAARQKKKAAAQNNAF